MRIDIDSMPLEIDQLNRKLRRLEIEKEVLKKEDDREAAARLTEIESRISELKEKRDPILLRWEHEKELIQQRQDLKEEIEKTSLAAEKAEREANYEEAARLKYGQLNELQKNWPLPAKNWMS